MGGADGAADERLGGERQSVEKERARRDELHQDRVSRQNRHHPAAHPAEVNQTNTVIRASDRIMMSPFTKKTRFSRAGARMRGRDQWPPIRAADTTPL